MLPVRIVIQFYSCT